VTTVTTSTIVYAGAQDAEFEPDRRDDNLDGAADVQPDAHRLPATVSEPRRREVDAADLPDGRDEERGRSHEGTEQYTDEGDEDVDEVTFEPADGGSDNSLGDVLFE
jgi:hypothetical protein